MVFHSSAERFGLFLRAVITALMFSFAAYAQEEVDAPTVHDELGAISSIQVEGNKKIEKDAILGKIKSKVGERAKRTQIAEDVRAIQGLGFFDDVKVDYAGSSLKFIVVERPTIASVSFEGNEQASDSDLKEVVKIKEYSILDVNKVKEDIALIQKYYEEKGFYLARVEYEARPGSKPDEVALVYKVTDFDKVRIKKVTFINNKRFSDEKLKSALRGTREGNFFSWASGAGNFRDAAFKQDLQMLTYLYLMEGYVRFRHEAPVVTISDDKKWLFITIYVDEGEKFKVGDIDFGGELLFEKKELHESTELTTGKIFNIETRNADIQRLTEKYQDLGYAFVNVNPKMAINDATRTVDIVYDFEKGNLVHFGEINIVGNSKTRDKVIRRELRIHEGELYNGTRFRVSRERVERLGYFGQGEVVFNTVVPKDNPDTLDVEVSIKERSTGTVTLGMGYGSIQKFFLTAQIQEINLFGRGQSLSLSGQFASNQQSRTLSLGFTEPYLMDTNWSSGFDVFYTSYPIPGRYLIYKKGVNVKGGHPISDEINAYLTYKLEHMRLAELASNTIDVEADKGILSSMGFSVVRDVRNNRFETTKGDYESLSAEYAGLGGDKYFTKVIGNARYYRPLFENLVFRTNFEAGHIIRNRNSRAVPPSERFYLGGPNSLKGFNLFAVSPRTAAGVPFGGVSQLLYTAEVEYPLIKEAGLKFVTFFDAGNTYETFNDMITVQSVKKDYGFGFRWFSPIGPLRFEWGFPISPKPGEDSVVFNFYIGPPF